MNPISVYKTLSLGGEITLNTPVAGANDTVVGSGTRYYHLFTTPNTAALFRITGLEVLNGTVVNNTFTVGIDSIDANPPVLVHSSQLVGAIANTQTGTSVVQRMTLNSIVGTFLQGNTLYAAFLVSASATARYGTTTVGSANRVKAITLTGTPVLGNATAWSAGTEEPYIKIYGRPIVG